MDLLGILGVDSPDDIDPHRPIEIAGLTLGPDATREAIRLSRQPADIAVHCRAKPGVEVPFYWALSRRGSEIGEVFGFPTGQMTGLPTALEVALIRAISSAPEPDLTKIIEGSHLVSLGKADEIGKICSVLHSVRPPIFGKSILIDHYRSINLTEGSDEQLTPSVIKCLQGSFEAMPLKFRFLELYRSMEARFLREIKETLLGEFDARPKIALDNAVSSLKSELKQFILLSQIRKPYFEMIWSAAETVKNTNTLAIALFRKMSSHGELGDSQSKAGAALVYFLRCAIVHAGQKDMIYEAYSDGDDLLTLVMEHVEEASLALAGVHLT